jgi:hypothetical protein
VETVSILFDTLAKLRKELDIDFEFINIGGGLGIPYKPTGQSTVDVGRIVDQLAKIFKEKQAEHNLTTGQMPKLFMENGKEYSTPCEPLNTCTVKNVGIFNPLCCSKRKRIKQTVILLRVCRSLHDRAFRMVSGKMWVCQDDQYQVLRSRRLHGELDETRHVQLVPLHHGPRPGEGGYPGAGERSGHAV